MTNGEEKEKEEQKEDNAEEEVEGGGGRIGKEYVSGKERGEKK